MTQPDIDTQIEEYCTCGAKQGTIDGYYKCTKDCLTTKIKTLLIQSKIKMLEDFQEAHKTGMFYGRIIELELNQLKEEL